MKYYATQIRTDPEGNPTILKQIEIGIPRINFWEMRNVCDTNGNTYYSYGEYVVKVPIDAEDEDDKVTININTALTLSNYEVLCLAIDKAETYLYIMINTSIADNNLRFYRISLSNFSLSPSDLYKDLTGDSISNSVETFRISKTGDIWICKDGSSSGRYSYVIDADTQTIIQSSAYLFGSFICVDARNIGWSFGGYSTSSLQQIQRQIYVPNTSLTTTNMGTTTYAKIVDLVTYTDNTNYYIYALQNDISDITNPCKIYKIDITDYNSIVEPVTTITLTGIVDAYNLHLNRNGDIFFSSYGTIDGYNTYKIDKTTLTFDKVTNLYIAGLGSKTTANDPYAFFVSEYGHTGANID